MRIAICPGSFDPITKGHVDIIERAEKLFDRIVVVVMSNSAKTTMFSAAERVELVKKSVGGNKNIEIDSFEGLLANYVTAKGACAVVRGLRAVSDFEYEFQMALTNKQINPNYETLFLTTSAQYLYLSSSIVKQIASFNGDISDFVPSEVRDDILKKFR